MMNKLIEVEIPDAITSGASEEQMACAADAIFEYMGGVDKQNAEQVQKNLRLLAGLANTVADGLTLAATTRH